jgi:hypothetical protein
MQRFAVVMFNAYSDIIQSSPNSNQSPAGTRAGLERCLLSRIDDDEGVELPTSSMISMLVARLHFQETFFPSS